MSYISSRNIFIIFLIGVFIYSGVLLSGADLWDGVLVSHAFDTKQYFIYHNWFTESGWPLVPYMYDLLRIATSEKEFIYLVFFVIIIFHILSSLEIVRIIGLVLKVKNDVSLLGGVLFLVSPGWGLYYSSVFLMHSITIFIALYCVRKFLEGKWLFFYGLLSFVSFQQSSNPALILSILFINVILNKKIVLSNIKFEVIYFISSVFVFFFLRGVFSTSGLYTDYNKISISSLFDLKMYLQYAFYFIYTNSLLILISLISFFCLRDKKLFYKYILLGFILLLNSIPYVAVGKVPLYNELSVLNGYSLRFSFTGIFVFSFLFSIVLNQINTKKIKFSIIIIVLSQTLYFNFLVQQSKLKSIIYQHEYILALRNIAPLPDCIVIINPNGSYTPSFYEVNYIFNKAYGNITQFPMGPDISSPELESNFRKLIANPIYRAKYILPEKYPNCSVNIKINSTVDRMNTLTVLAWFLGHDVDKGTYISIEKQ